MPQAAIPRLLTLLLALLPAAAPLGVSPGASRPIAARDDSSTQEYQLKAAYIFNFTNFVEWPKGSFESAKDPIVVGVLGKDPFGKALEKTFEGRKVGQRRLTVERYEHLSKASGCHVLFVAQASKKEMGGIAAFCRSHGILTITEADGMIDSGAIVNFYVERQTIRFEIQVDEAARSKLTISSRLLRLARVVHDKTRDEEAGSE